MSELGHRRKRLLYQAQHRGTKELDLLIGGFAQRHLEQFDAAQLERFEALLKIPEPVIYAWMTKASEPPEELRHDVMWLLLQFEHCPAAR